jgi:hypothetical protein
MYNVEHFRKLMTGHEDLQEDEEPKKKKISLKQLFDGEPKVISKKKTDKKVMKKKLNKK